MKNIFLVLLLLGTTAAAWAQAEQSSVIINRAVGPGFTVNREGLEQYIEVGKNTQVGYKLKPGDIVNVEARTFLEVVCLPQNTILDVAELTSFSVVGMDSGGVRMALYYGRMKARIPGKSGKGNLEIIGPQAMVLTKASDFGYDFIYNSDGKLVNQIYCIQGDVDVFPRQTDETAAKQTPKTSLKAKEMIAISGFFTSGEYEKKFFEEDILQYWKENSVEERLKKLASLGSDEEVVVKARDVEKKEEGKEKPIDEMLDRKEETAKEKEATEEKPKETPAPGKGVHFTLDYGMDFSFLVYSSNPPTGGLFDLLGLAGLDWLVDFLNFITNVRAGAYLDGVLMLNEYIGFGLESGLSYNFMIIDDVTIHIFAVPAYLVIRGNVGIFFTQLYGGLFFVGVVVDNDFGNMDLSLAYELGLRLGVNLGSMTVYASAGVSFPDFDHLFAGTYDWRGGLGLKFNIGNF